MGGGVGGGNYLLLRSRDQRNSSCVAALGESACGAIHGMRVAGETHGRVWTQRDAGSAQPFLP